MTKQQAIAVFGSGTALARALGITKSAVSQWPDDLPQRTIDEINGAAMRLGLIAKSELPLEKKEEAA